MKILKTKTDVDDLRELRDRKAELKARMDTERTELRNAWQEVRADFQPGQIATSIVQSLMGGSGSGVSQLQTSLRLATDFLMGNPNTRLLFKLVAPLALAYLPRVMKKAKGLWLKKTRSTVYGALRKSISSLRSQLKRKKARETQELDTGDIIQPS